MKTITVSCIIALAALTASHAGETNKTFKTMTPAEKAAYKAAMFRKSGGFGLFGAEGCVKVISYQKALPLDNVKSAGEAFSKQMKIVIASESASGSFSLADADKLQNNSKANAVVFVVADPTLPMTLVAPESRWGVVNVTKLSEGDPTRDVLAKRVHTAVFRAIAGVIGAYGSQYPGTIMEGILSAKEMGNHSDYAFIPDSQMAVVNFLPKIGMKQGQTITYAKACKLGIAPAPTNDIQKAIWEEVHAPPSKPIKITYDKDKQKPVVK